MVAAVGTIRTGGVAALAAAGLLVGCGGSSGSGGDAASVKQTVTRAFGALAAGDGATLCSLATQAGQRTLASALPHSTCAKVVELVSVHLTPLQKAGLESVQIKKVTVAGDHATINDADFSSSRGSLKGFISSNSAPTRLTKQPDGSWKISG